MGKSKKEMTKTEKKTLVGGLCSLLLFLAFGAYLLITAGNKNVQSVTGNGSLKYYIWMFFGLLTIVFAVKNRIVFGSYVGVLFAFFLWLSFADVQYSIIDEIMNFENINHIVAHNELAKFDDPVDVDYINSANNGANGFGAMTNYEAVQAPLFYLVMAIPGKFLADSWLRFHVFRVISLLSVWLVYFFLRKTVKYLEAKKLLQVDEEILRLGVLLTIFSPAYLFRASRINNEILVCILCAAVMYVAVRLVVEGYRLRDYFIMAFLCSACFLTKNTAIYAYIVFGVIVLLQKKIWKGIMTVAIGALPILPWFAFNYKVYGSPIAMRRHFQIVLAAVNPEHKMPNLFEVVFQQFSSSFYSAEEVAFTGGEIFWNQVVFFMLLLLLAHFTIEAVTTLWQKKFAFETYDTKTRLNLICTAMVLGNLAALIAGTVLSRVVSLRGRYFFAPCVAVILLMLLNKNVITVKAKKYAVMLLAIALSVVTIRTAVFFLNKVYTNEQWFGTASIQQEENIVFSGIEEERS